jgi:hypothetical protein
MQNSPLFEIKSSKIKTLEKIEFRISEKGVNRASVGKSGKVSIKQVFLR